MLDILDMKKQQPVAVFFNGLGGIAASLKIMSDIEFQLRVARIGSGQDLIYFLGTFAERAHVIVISERNAEIRGAFANFRKQVPEAFVVRGSNGVILRATVA